MSNKKYGSLPLWWWLVMFLTVSAIASAMTLTDWGSIWAIIAGIIAVSLVLWAIGFWLFKKLKINEIHVCYLRPRSHYPNNLTFNDAPDNEEFPTRLTLNPGKYTIFIQMHSPMNITINRTPLISFIGDEANKPKIIGKNNPFIREQLSNEYVRDWWGDFQPIGKKYPYLFDHTKCFQEPNQILTTGKWRGKLSIVFTIDGIGDVERLLDFSVSLNPNDDEVPYLKNFGIEEV